MNIYYQKMRSKASSFKEMKSGRLLCNAGAKSRASRRVGWLRNLRHIHETKRIFTSVLQASSLSVVGTDN